MIYIVKHSKYSAFRIFGLFFLGSLVFACSSSQNKQENIVLEGYTQGTTYRISYWGNNQINYQRAIDSILIAFDNSLSTYNKKSILTKFNNSDTLLVVDDFFILVFNSSKKIYHQTNGAFNPTVTHLVNAWGFGFKNTEKTDSLSIDSLLKLVDFDAVTIKNDTVFKSKKELMLDFNAIAQGYSVDVVANFLEENEIENYLIEIGGELRAKGNNINGNLWRVGIDKPIENQENRVLKAIVNIGNGALATSGNYRKFYEKNGQKFSHTINPKTGYPVRHSLLSATVVTKDCASADALATAFMVLGLEESKVWLEKNSEIDALLIYDDGKGGLATFITPTLEKMVEIIE